MQFTILQLLYEHLNRFLALFSLTYLLDTKFTKFTAQTLLICAEVISNNKIKAVGKGKKGKCDYRFSRDLPCFFSKRVFQGVGVVLVES